MRIGVCPYPLPAGRASAPQDVVNSGAPSAQVYCDEIGSIRPGSLFLTLPTRGLTGQHLISSEGGMVDPVAPLGPPAYRVVALTAAFRSVL